MCTIISLERSVYARILKCLMIRLVMKVLPPPGGPIVHKISRSSKFMIRRILRSYQPLWSRY